MKSWLRNLLDSLITYLIILPGFHIIIVYSAIHERIKEFYYQIFSIPYIKQRDKGNTYVKRVDR